MVADGGAVGTAPRSPERSAAIEAHTPATDCAISAIALSGTERLRVARLLAHAALESLAALGASDEGPSTRHSHAGMVVADVTGHSDQLKVRKAVVSPVAVEVVDLLMLCESASKMLPHDEAMLKDVDARAGDLDVSVVSDAANS